MIVVICEHPDNDPYILRNRTYDTAAEAIDAIRDEWLGATIHVEAPLRVRVHDDGSWPMCYLEKINADT